MPPVHALVDLHVEIVEVDTVHVPTRLEHPLQSCVPSACISDIPPGVARAGPVGHLVLRDEAAGEPELTGLRGFDRLPHRQPEQQRQTLGAALRASRLGLVSHRGPVCPGSTPDESPAGLRLEGRVTHSCRAALICRHAVDERDSAIARTIHDNPTEVAASAGRGPRKARLA